MSTATKQMVLGRGVIDADSKDFVVDTDPPTGPFPVALTPGNYYIVGYAGESTAQLCEHMQAQIRAADAAFSSATVTFLGASGRVTIDFGVDATLVWTDTDLQDILGYDGDLSGGIAYEGAKQPYWVWRPTLGMSQYPLDLKTLWAPRSTARVGRSKDGTSYSVPGTILYDAPVEWENLPDSDVVVPDSGTINEDLQTFWERVCALGRPVRIYTDRTEASSEWIHEGMVVGTEEGEPVGSYLDLVGRARRTYNDLWDVRLNVQKYIA